MSYRIRTSADVIILNEIGTTIDVASYHVGSMPDRQTEIMTTLALNPLQPAVIAMQATGDTSGLRRIYLRGNRICLWMVMLPAIPLMFFGVPLAKLYAGEIYAAAGIVMLLLCARYPFTWSVDMPSALAS